ncbi:hypothetical protein [Bdellovibrio sp. HCB337]|uniref:hypothetical protein n=1 Tax=Bdellovibrio sp. HCB337 TaxID=3394358 RepID=UPI0039A4C4EF
MKWLLLLSLFSFSWAQADGHSVNNGGGVICINGQCKTLIEAGLEVKPEYNGVWLPSKDLIAKIRANLELTAFHYSVQKDLLVRILGRLDHFRQVQVIDPRGLDAIKRQYVDLANQAGFQIDPKTFELVAFSSDNTVDPAMTYILPKFFDLTLEQQASILIHEGLYRGQPSNSLRYVLQLEAAMEQDSDVKEIANKINSQIAAFHLQVINKAQLLGHLLLTAMGDDTQFGIGNRHEGARTFGDLKRYNNGAIDLVLDQAKVLEVAEREPRIPYILSKTTKLKFASFGTDDNYTYEGDEYLTLDDNGSLIFADKTSHTSNEARIYVLESPDELDLVLPN